MNTQDPVTTSYIESHPDSSAMFQRASSLLAGRYGHDLRRSDPFPLYITRGAGSRKWDVDGIEYVDYRMGNAALMLGHAHREVVDAIKEAAEKGTHFGNDHPLQFEWAELLQESVPSAELVRFVSSGTEATYLAHRIARAHTGKPKLVKLEGHFHGWHDHVLKGMAPPFSSIPSAGIPDRVHDEVTVVPHDIEYLNALLQEHRDIGAVILEPSGASWGRVPMSDQFLQDVRATTQSHETLLVFDEVITGFRWSDGGAQKKYGVTPDLTCMAKIAAGGMPGGALVGTRDVMRNLDFETQPKVIHYGTFNAAPLTAAAAVATIRIIKTTDAISHADRLAQAIREKLAECLDSHSIAGFSYGTSSTFHVYFETDPAHLRDWGQMDATAVDASRLKGMPSKTVLRYQLLMRHHGVDLVSSTGGVTSAVHSDADASWLLEAFDRTVQTLKREGLVAVLR